MERSIIPSCHIVFARIRYKVQILPVNEGDHSVFVLRLNLVPVRTGSVALPSFSIASSRLGVSCSDTSCSSHGIIEFKPLFFSFSPPLSPLSLQVSIPIKSLPTHVYVTPKHFSH